MTRTASTLEFSTAPHARSGPRFALLWLVVALLFQGFATQTHAHFAVDRTSISAESARVAVAAVDGQPNGPAAPACPLCEEKALFGAYLLSGSIAIAAPVDVAYHYMAASLPLLAPRLTSHAWRSRAPPILTA